MAFKSISGLGGKPKRQLKDNQAKKSLGKARDKLIFEALEPRILLSADLPLQGVTDDARQAIYADNAPVVISADILKQVSGRNSDVLLLELPALVGSSAYSMDLISFQPTGSVNGSGSDNFRLSLLADTNDYLLEKKVAENNWQPIGKLVLPEHLGDTKTFAGNGKLYFLPDVADSPDGTSPVGFTGGIVLKYDGQAVCQITVRENTFSPDPDELITGDGSMLDVMRIQQRLRALGYPGVSGGALRVDGRLGPNTLYAIGSFNAHVQNKLNIISTDKIDLAWINDAKAPGRLDAAPTERRLSSTEQQALARVVEVSNNWFSQTGQQDFWKSTAPLLAGTVGQFLPLSDIAKELIARTFDDIKSSDTVANIEDTLKNGHWSFDIPIIGRDGISHAQHFEFGFVESSVHVTITDTGIRISGKLQDSTESLVAIGFDENAAKLGIALTGLNTLPVTRIAELAFDYEILSAPSLSTEKALKVHQLYAEARLELSKPEGAVNLPVNAQLRVGGMEGKIENGHIDIFQLKVHAGLKDGEVGKTLAELSKNQGFDLGYVETTVKGALPMTMATGLASAPLKYDQNIDFYDKTALAELIDFNSVKFSDGAHAINLPEFNQIDTKAFIALLEKLRDWFNAFGESIGQSGSGPIAWPEIELPHLGKVSFPDIGQLLRKLGGWLEIPELGGGKTDVALPQFSLPSWQELLGLIPGFHVGKAEFDIEGKTLKYQVELDERLDNYLSALTLNGISSNRLTRLSLLADINGGIGITDIDSGLSCIQATLRNGENFDVTLTGCKTLGDVMDKISLASQTLPGDSSTCRIRIEINGASDRLVLTDLTSGEGVFKITALNGLKVADPLVGLGVIGEDLDADGSLTSASLAGLNGGVLEAVVKLKGSFTVGVDFKTLGDGFKLTSSTLLSELNGKGGVVDAATDKEDLKITFADGTSIQVSLAGLTTAQDVIARLQAAAPSKLQAGVSLDSIVDKTELYSLHDSIRNMSGDTSRFWLRDLTYGKPGSNTTFRVEAINGSLRGAAFLGLGLVGEDTDGQGGGDGIIAGSELHGDSVEDHVFVKFEANDALNVTVELTAKDIDARLDIGGLMLGVSNGTANVTGTATLKLNDPGQRLARLADNTFSVRGVDGRITLLELATALGDTRDTLQYGDKAQSRFDRLAGTLVLKGNAELELPLVSNPSQLLQPGAGISVHYSDLSDESSLVIESHGLDLVEGTKNFVFDQVIANLKKIQDNIGGLEKTEIFQQELPFLGQNLADIVGLSTKYGQFVDELAKHRVDTVEQLAEAISNALASLTDNGSGASGKTSYVGKTIALSINFKNQGQQDLPFNLDLANLGALASITGLNGELLSANGKLAVAYLGQCTLNLEVDVSDPTTPVVYIRDTSKVKVGLGVHGDNIDIGLNWGPLGGFINKGNIRLDFGLPILDNPTDTTIDYSRLAFWTADVKDDVVDHRYALDGKDFGADSFVTVAKGKLNANLPVMFPTKTTFLDPNVHNLVVKLDLANPSSTNNLIIVPDITARLNGIADFTKNLNSVWEGFSNGLDSALDALDSLLDDSIFNANLPLIGLELKEGVTFLKELRAGLDSAFAFGTKTKTKAVLQNALNTTLKPYLKSGSSVTYTSSAGDRLEMLIPLAIKETLADIPLDADLGLPGLGLSLGGNIDADLTISWDLKIGFSKADGVYLAINPKKSELAIDLVAKAPNFLAAGTLGFLTVTAKDDENNPTHLAGRFAVDLLDPSNDNRLTLADLNSGADIGQLVKGRITDITHLDATGQRVTDYKAGAEINLVIESGISGDLNLPRLKADFSVSWSLSGAATSAVALGTLDSIGYDNVQFNAGNFINGIFKPMLDDAKKILEPLRPAIEFLTKPLPGISQLAGRAVNLLEVAKIYAPDQAQEVSNFITRVNEVDQLIGTLDAISGDGWISIGKLNDSVMDLSVKTGGDLLDPRLLGISAANLKVEITASDKADVMAALNGMGASSLYAVGTGGTSGFEFPIFESPSLIMGLLLGKEVDFVTYVSPHFSAKLEFMLAEIPIIPPVLMAQIKGALGFEAQFTMGYDTAGIRRYNQTGFQADLLYGFYVSDQIVGGKDRAELVFYGEIGVYAAFPKLDLSLSFGPISGGINVDVYAGGGIRAALGFNLNDPNHDGKVRGDELASNWQFGPEYVFDIEGRIDFVLKAHAFVQAWAEVKLGPFSTGRKTWTLINQSYQTVIPLLSYEMKRPENTPVLGQVVNGTLTLNVGNQAGLRKNGNTADGKELIRISRGATSDTVVINGFGYEQTFSGVNAIQAHLGKDNDIVQVGEGVLDFPDKTATPRINIFGDDGDDVLINLGDTAVNFYGGTGNDQLTGGTGADHLDGGDDNDLLAGGAGNDVLLGGLGDDQLQGGTGDDTIAGFDSDGASIVGQGQTDKDIIMGDAGADTIKAGADNDRVASGAGADTILAGAGDDVVDGGDDSDTVYGGAGSDQLSGGRGGDLLHGDDGNDVLQGGAGADALFGDVDDDVLWGGLDNDTLDGGDGSDGLYGGEDAAGTQLAGITEWGKDTLIGGLGRDYLYAGSGSESGAVQDNTFYGDLKDNALEGDGDHIFGGQGKDTVHGGGGNDTINTFASDDQIYGEAGNDIIKGGAGEDKLVGGAGNDDLAGEGGYDVVWGGAELVNLSATELKTTPTLLGLPEGITIKQMAAFVSGANIVPKDAKGKNLGSISGDGDTDGSDRLSGGDLRDWLFGGLGDDAIVGDSGEDYLDGGAGRDILNGGDNADVLRGGNDNDELHGGSGSDLLYGDRGNDALWGDAAGSDQTTDKRQRLFGGEDDDYLYAWSGTAPLNESKWVGDMLKGDAGRDFLFGGLRKDELNGGEGNDVLRGDAFAANQEQGYTSQQTLGGNDVLKGEAGEDVLQGGGGNDVLLGGAGDDRLEGQRGSDNLKGEWGSDVLVVDFNGNNTDIDTFDGGDNTANDGVDRGLVIGTEQGDTFTVKRATDPILQVSRKTGLTTKTAKINWGKGTAVKIDQFHLLGQGGNDIMTVDDGVASALNAKGGWSVVMEGGLGDDTLKGTSQRDYLDGGVGSDTVSGFAGNDQLWGDADNLGSSQDTDKLYGGQGGDDLYGGKIGKNELYAWTQDPDPNKNDGQFGVFIKPDGTLTDNNGDLDGDGKLDDDPTAGPYELEDTGTNRMVGGGNNDLLYGGSGLDAMIGNDGENQYFDRWGKDVEVKGTAVFKQNPDYVPGSVKLSNFWMYGGTNGDDKIEINYVTEPGLLKDHHLITRSTKNGTSYTFDAAVRLDFSHWESASLANMAAVFNGEDIDNMSAAWGYDSRTIDRNVLISSLLPPEGLLNTIFIDALQGGDEVIVGPTVQASVWVDAGVGNDTVKIESGQAILVDRADQIESKDPKTGIPIVLRNDIANKAAVLSNWINSVAGKTVNLFESPVELNDLTLDNPNDNDWFSFNVSSVVKAARIMVSGLSTNDGMRLELYKAVLQDGKFILGNRIGLGTQPQENLLAVISLTDLASGDYLLKVSDNKRPTRYQLLFDKGDGALGSAANIKIDLGASVSDQARRDLILGGSGNDTLIGGSGEDYIDGGAGDDLISGGADQQKTDVLFGGDGNDIFQIWTDVLAEGQFPAFKQDDLFVGGVGDDRVLFFGGTNPDFAALRYNTINQRYEFANRIWDENNKNFIIGSDGKYELNYAFFRTQTTEAIQIELGAGNDEFHADDGYQSLDGTSDPTKTWGLGTDARPLGAIDSLNIYGGGGNDRLYGGAGRDYISGDDGDDLIVGGASDDELKGGNDNDFIVGNTLEGLTLVSPYPDTNPYTDSVESDPSGRTEPVKPSQQVVAVAASLQTLEVRQAYKVFEERIGNNRFHGEQDQRFNQLPSDEIKHGFLISLAAGENDVWYRFSTSGDGSEGDGFIAVPNDSVTPMTITLVKLDSATAIDGYEISSGTFASLASLPAGDYAIKVSRRDGSTDPYSAKLYGQLPERGFNLVAEKDADTIEGGGGRIDFFVGGPDLDTYLDVSEITLEPPEAQVDQKEIVLDDITNPLVHFDNQTDGSESPIALAIAKTLGKTSGQLTTSDILGITELDLSGYKITDLGGLEQLIYLHKLNLSGQNLVALSWTTGDAEIPHELSDLQHLRHLDVSDNQLFDIRVLSKLTELRTLDLSGNQITEMGALLGITLVDKPTTAYGSGWLGDQNSGAYQGTYSFHPAGTGSSAYAEWLLGVVLEGSYKVFVTWPEHESRSDSVPFTIKSGDQNLTDTPLFINQKLTPEGDSYLGGRPWQSLGIFSFDGEQPASVQMALASDGSVAADGVYLQRVDEFGNPVGPMNSLVSVDLHGNPLNLNAYSGEIDALQASVLKNRQNDSTIDPLLENKGAQFRVDTDIPAYPYSSQIAALADGGYVVIWVAETDVSSEYGVYSQRYDAAGKTVGDIIKVSHLTVDLQNPPQITRLADGGFVVIWNTGGTFDAEYGIYGQRFDANGSLLGSNFAVSVSATSYQSTPKITALADGFVVIWVSDGLNGLDTIYGQRYLASGTAIGQGFKVNGTASSPQSSPDIITLAEGGFVIVWESYEDNGSVKLLGQRYSKTAEVLGGEFRVNTTMDDYQFAPKATALADGGFVVIWSSESETDPGIYGQRYGSDGQALGIEFKINGTSTGYVVSPNITALNDGGFMVVWTALEQEFAGSFIKSCRYDANGNRVGDEFSVANNPGYSLWAAKATSLTDGDVIVVWDSTSEDGMDRAITGQRYAMKVNVDAYKGERALPPTDDESITPIGTDKSLYKGKVYQDDGVKGLYEGFEQGLEGWRVYLDTNADGVWNPTEAYTFTDANGNYELVGASNAKVRAVAPGNNWINTVNLAGEPKYRIGYAKVLDAGQDRRGNLTTPLDFDVLTSDRFLSTPGSTLAVDGWKIFDANNTLVASGTDSKFTFTPPGSGHYHLIVEAHSTGRSRTDYTDHVDIYIDNSAPILDVGAVSDGTPVTIPQAVANSVLDLDAAILNASPQALPDNGANAEVPSAVNYSTVADDMAGAITLSIPKINFIKPQTPLFNDFAMTGQKDWLSAWVDGVQDKPKTKQGSAWRITLPK